LDDVKDTDPKGPIERLGQLLVAIGVIVIVVVTLTNRGEFKSADFLPDFMTLFTAQTITFTRIGAAISVIGMLIWAKVWTLGRKGGR
jgi:uncharacterized protein (DUF488 family)